jgi:hypothetical protein
MSIERERGRRRAAARGRRRGASRRAARNLLPCRQGPSRAWSLAPVGRASRGFGRARSRERHVSRGRLAVPPRMGLRGETLRNGRRRRRSDGPSPPGVARQTRGAAAAARPIGWTLPTTCARRRESGLWRSDQSHQPRDRASATEWFSTGTQLRRARITGLPRRKPPLNPERLLSFLNWRLKRLGVCSASLRECHQAPALLVPELQPDRAQPIPE